MSDETDNDPDGGIEGQTIAEFRPMTDEEMDDEGWRSRTGRNPTVLVLENGTKIYPSRDPEGNGPGTLFGRRSDGTAIYVNPNAEI